MKKYFFLLIVTGALMGCSPQVTSELVTEGLSPQPTNKVMIVDKGESTGDMQTIGQVTVDGKAESVKSEYGKMLGMAVRETAQKGGNVLVMDYSEMDKNRLKGTMAYTDGEVNDSLTLSVRRIDELKHQDGCQESNCQCRGRNRYNCRHYKQPSRGRWLAAGRRGAAGHHV